MCMFKKWRPPGRPVEKGDCSPTLFEITIEVFWRLSRKGKNHKFFKHTKGRVKEKCLKESRKRLRPKVGLRPGSGKRSR